MMKRFSILSLGLLLAVFLAGIASAETDYRALGEKWMDQMMGDRHEAADKLLEEQMGGQFVDQMHEAMGRMVSSGRGYTMMPMMMSMMNNQPAMPGGWSPSLAGGWFWLTGLLALLFWAGLLVLIFLAIVKLWQSIKKSK
jgi:hypothetical protein